ncbi:MAG: hypothetical protein ACPL7B_07665, partial [Candidatus Poribacteria bacterium]
HHPEKYGITWMSNNWSDYYLVGKGGSFKPCFTTSELTVDRQIYLHDLLYNGLKQICKNSPTLNYAVEKGTQQNV